VAEPSQQDGDAAKPDSPGRRRVIPPNRQQAPVTQAMHQCDRFDHSLDVGCCERRWDRVSPRGDLFDQSLQQLPRNAPVKAAVVPILGKLPSVVAELGSETDQKLGDPVASRSQLSAVR
jgi:hypothetical protein